MVLFWLFFHFFSENAGKYYIYILQLISCEKGISTRGKGIYTREIFNWFVISKKKMRVPWIGSL